MKKLFLISILQFVISISLFSQISGRVKDANSGDPLVGAHIILYHNNGHIPTDHTITGKEGEFIFTGDYGKSVGMVVSYVGYKVYQKSVTLLPDGLFLSVELQPAAVPVGEVTINATRKEANLMEVSIPMAVATSREIDRIGGFSPADMLKNEPGVALSRDGIWATSFNIRGLSEQRIVTLIDGNRVETAADIAAGMAMIDINDIERIEIIKGAASSLYGTGAMGGVVNIITKPGYYAESLLVGGGLAASYQSVNKMHSENGHFQLSHPKWYFRASGTLRDAQNIHTPKGELENSQFQDNNISLKAGVKPFANQELKLNFQRFFANDVGLPGGSAFPANATASYKEIYRNLFSASYIFKLNKPSLKDIEFKYFHQYISRDVILKPNSTTTISPSGYHTTNGFQVQSSLSLPGANALIAGIDIWQRLLDTEREKDIYQPVMDSSGNVVNTNHIVRGEIPIPHSAYTSTGIFFNNEHKAFHDKLRINFGGRFDLITVKNDLALDPLYIIMNGTRNDNPPNQRITFPETQADNYSWSANLGMIYRLYKRVDLTLNLSRAFRSPSIEERYKYIDLGSRVRVGDPKLKPEDGYFSDLGIRVWGEKVNINANAFVNSLSNLIVEKPGVIIYNYTADPAKADTLPALINSNVDKALLAGFDLSVNISFFQTLSFIGSSSFVRGIDTRHNTDLPMIPPFYSRIGLRYEEHFLNAAFFVNLSAGQDKIALGETKTSGFATYDLNLSTKPMIFGFGTMGIFAGIENLTDRAYINHLATNRGIIKYEPGRNFFLKMKLEF